MQTLAHTVTTVLPYIKKTLKISEDRIRTCPICYDLKGSLGVN